MRCSKWCLVLLAVVATCFPSSGTDEDDLLSPFLHGTVFSKDKSQPVEDALVVLAERVMEDERYKYKELASVISDSEGKFLFADRTLWEEKRDLVLLVWKRFFAWQSDELPEHFYNDVRKQPVQIYLPPAYLEQGKCPTCPVTTPPSHRVNVFYATDREASAVGPLTFLNEPDAKKRLHYGLCEAGIEALSNSDPVAVDKGFVNGLQAYASSNDLFSAIIANHPSSVLIFIHGYQNSFAAACSAAAQVAYDTRFEGAVLIFSWPSQDRVMGYKADGESVKSSTGHLNTFLQELSAGVGLPMHMLAHSMGNRALLAAITPTSGSSPSRWHLGQVLFAAPDVDSGDFRNQFSHGIDARRATLYASNHDLALAASKLFHFEFKRAGDSDPEIDTMPNLDSVDASRAKTDLRGHSYYRDSWSVLSDIRLVVQYDMPPSTRFGLMGRKKRGGDQYWIITSP
jgi:esterase/lipase superfamily enzyme